MLLLQLAAVADTLVVRQVPAVQSGFEQVVFVASGITSVLALVLIVAALIALVQLRAGLADTHGKLDTLLTELRPLVQNATAMTADVREVAAAASEVIDDSRETIEEVNAKVRTTVDSITGRVEDLGDMLGRIHDSAERVASIAGTAIGGIKLGARVFGIGRGKKKKAKRPLSRSAARRQRLAEDAEAERPRLRRRD
ncbi:MAG: hypothetical protein WD771_11095 [Gemmatimonadaceae bacterium]